VGAALGATLIAHGFALPEGMPTPPMDIQEIAATLRANEGRRVRVTYWDDLVECVDVSSVDDEGFLHDWPDGAAGGLYGGQCVAPGKYWSRFGNIKTVDPVTGGERMTHKNAQPGDRVVLERLPPGLVDGLPEDDQIAIREIIGKPVRLNQYDEDGRAELEFTSIDGHIHFIWVDPSVIRRE
jgi:hypothetical protein